MNGPPLLTSARAVAAYLNSNPPMQDRWAARDRLRAIQGSDGEDIWYLGKAAAGHTLGDGALP